MNVLYSLLLFALFLPAPAMAEIRFGIEPRGSAEETRKSFGPLAEYLAEALGMPVRLMIADDFNDYGRKLNQREYDLTFAAPATILYSMELSEKQVAAVALDRDSGASLRGVFLVHANSPIQSLSDLRGKRIAYVARSSQGYIVQSYTLRQAGLDPEKDIEATFTQKLDSAVAALLEGHAEAAGVGDVVFNKLRDKVDLRGLRVLSMSPATPNWVMVNLFPEKTPAVARALLKLEKNSELAKRVLGEKNFVGFAALGPNELDLLRLAVKAAKAE